MQIEELIKVLNDMILLYGNKIILTIKDSENTIYKIKSITGNQCAENFMPYDKVAEVIINIDKWNI